MRPQKILVVTFTSDTNPGTYMQAYGVYTGLAKAFPGATIEYLDFPNFKCNLTNENKEVDSRMRVIERRVYALIRRFKYNRLRSKWCLKSNRVIDLFNYTEDDIAYIKENYDLVVIGSDTILEKAYSDNGTIGLNWMPIDVKKVYFAASASPAQFDPDEQLAQVVAKAKYIGLRDDLTMQLFSTGLKISKDRLHHQPDPTYFLDCDKFVLPQYMARRLAAGTKWAFCNFSPTFTLKKEIATILREKGYKIVSPEYNNYADVCVATVDACQWAGLFKHVDLIVTDRFHDSVFALRACRPVINLDWEAYRFDDKGNSKTRGILKDYGLERYHLNIATPDDIKPIASMIDDIEQTFDPDSVKAINDKQRAKANHLLDLMKDSVSANQR